MSNSVRMYQLVSNFKSGALVFRSFLQSDNSEDIISSLLFRFVRYGKVFELRSLLCVHGGGGGRGSFNQFTERIIVKYSTIVQECKLNKRQKREGEWSLSYIRNLPMVKIKREKNGHKI